MKNKLIEETKYNKLEKSYHPINQNFNENLNETFSDLDDDNSSIHQNMRIYNIDTSKVTTKMEDIGSSPFKTSQHSIEESETSWNKKKVIEK